MACRAMPWSEREGNRLRMTWGRHCVEDPFLLPSYSRLFKCCGLLYIYRTYFSNASSLPKNYRTQIFHFCFCGINLNFNPGTYVVSPTRSLHKPHSQTLQLLHHILVVSNAATSSTTDHRFVAQALGVNFF